MKTNSTSLFQWIKQDMRQMRRWQKRFVASLILTAIIVWASTDLVRTHNEALVFLIICGVVTYMLALAAFVKAFTKEPQPQEEEKESTPAHA